LGGQGDIASTAKSNEGSLVVDVKSPCSTDSRTLWYCKETCERPFDNESRAFCPLGIDVFDPDRFYGATPTPPAAVQRSASANCWFVCVTGQGAERIKQKERTRQALMRAARALIEEGQELTIARAAERAEVAEATAYRYYSSPRSLLRDALAIDWTGLDELLATLRTIGDVADRAELAAQEMARFVLEREVSVRQLFASTDQEPRDEQSPYGLPRASFRRRLVAEVLTGTEEMHSAELREVELALLVIVSPHAVLILRDAMANDPSNVPKELGRMARRLFGGITKPC
jgi:AcrR family transcriptional regulator